MFKCKDCKYLIPDKNYILENKIFYYCKITGDWTGERECNPNDMMCSYFKPVLLLHSLKIVFKNIIRWII